MSRDKRSSISWIYVHWITRNLLICAFSVERVIRNNLIEKFILKESKVDTRSNVQKKFESVRLMLVWDRNHCQQILKKWCWTLPAWLRSSSFISSSSSSDYGQPAGPKARQTARTWCLPGETSAALLESSLWQVMNFDLLYKWIIIKKNTESDLL